MLKYDCIFFDRDGTVNYDPGYISNLKDFKFFDFSISALNLLTTITNKFIVITNQSGISRGLVKENDLIEINNYIMDECINNNIPLLKIYYCIDHPDRASDRRKPGVGMFLEASEEFNLDVSNCLMIGDSISDIQPANNLGMESMLVLTGNGNTHQNRFSNNDSPNYCAENILVGAKQLVE